MADLVLKGMNLHGPRQRTLFLPLEKPKIRNAVKMWRRHFYLGAAKRNTLEVIDGVLEARLLFPRGQEVRRFYLILFFVENRDFPRGGQKSGKLSSKPGDRRFSKSLSRIAAHWPK